MSGGPVRPPLVSLTAAERDALAADLVAVGLCYPGGDPPDPRRNPPVA